MKNVIIAALVAWLPLNAIANDYEQVFEEKARKIIHQTADNYQPPSENIGDPEKYYWPLVIARFEKYGLQDSVANFWVNRFANNSPFHFTLVGMARILHAYEKAPSIAENKALILQKVFDRKDNHNAWTSEGTENHINMARTSGYLFACKAVNDKIDIPEAAMRKEQMDQWIRAWSRKLYQVGNGEWHSGIYQVYNIIGWLNLYDFADDPEIKLMAKAVLDFYATELAVYYSYGLQGGPEMRGSNIGSGVQEATTYLCWLWFSEQLNPPVDMQRSGYIQCVHAATSKYRPPANVVELALKEHKNDLAYKLSRPSYLLDKPSFVKQIFFVGKNFTFGSASSPYGGWTGSTYQMINWKLVVKNAQESELPYVVGGSGRLHNNFSGKSTDPFTQIVQHRNVLMQLSLMPENVEDIIAQVKDLCVVWDSLWRRDFTKRFPNAGEHHAVVNFAGNQKVNSNNASYLLIPRTFKIKKVKNAWVADAGNTWILIQNVSSNSAKILEVAHKDFQVLTDSTGKGLLCGFTVEVMDKTDFRNESEFYDYVNKKAKVKVEYFDDHARVPYVSYNTDKIEGIYNSNGTFEEALVDWGYGPVEPMVMLSAPPFTQPKWPYGAGFGRVPGLKVNGKLSTMHEESWPLLQGPDVLMHHGKLAIGATEKIYQVDYSGEVPKFSIGIE